MQYDIFFRYIDENLFDKTLMLLAFGKAEHVPFRNELIKIITDSENFVGHITDVSKDIQDRGASLIYEHFQDIIL